MSKSTKEQLNSIESKLDEHTTILANVDKTLALQAQQLTQHIKRTDLAEENITMLREEFKPVKRHVEFVNGFAKLVVIATAVIGAIVAVVQLFL